MAVILGPGGLQLTGSGEFFTGRPTNSLGGSSGTMLTFATNTTDNGIYLVGHYRDNSSSYAATAILVYRNGAGGNSIGYITYLHQQNTSFSIDMSTGALTWANAYYQGNWGFVIPLEQA
jgi:hypothetical protein